ncbi:MAG: glucosaminidase domain-containing protein [Gammaproteobacteria bacterium]
MLRKSDRLFLSLLALLWVSSSIVSAQESIGVDSESRRFEFESYADVATLAEELEYTADAWSAGIREVPRLFLTDIPPRWRDSTSREVTVQVKKALFFRLLGPLALRANELIANDRARAENLETQLSTGASLDPNNRQWLARLAVRYRVIADEAEELSEDALQELLNYRIQAVPVSLVLAQAAEESGWGTSRFAAEGNALFGQWTWGGNSIRPEQQRAGLGDYGIAAFEAPLESVAAYMLNLNTHPAYEELRARREDMVRAGERISGWELANTLIHYSERGPEYVESLHTIMRVNRLDPADDAYLSDGPTIFLVPVGIGAE